MNREAPERVGAHEIIREIGRGGMGIVYLARDPRLDRFVAIKSLPEELADDPARRARFECEAKAIAQLNHGNVATIYGVEDHDGATFLVLEYVEGVTLGDRIAAGPLQIAEAVGIAIEIARGVEAAHEAGVVHRDLKPDNIKLGPEGAVKVLDFGLAKLAAGASDAIPSEQSTLTTPASPTTPGAIVGTAAYMSPEQARGRSIDRRTDIWSFGVVLYEMLVGASPFAGETISDSIGAVLHKDVELERLPAATPPALRRALRRLERDPLRRYRDLGDARLDLEEALLELDTTSVVAGPTPPPSRRWSGAIALIASIVALAAIGLLVFGSRAPASPVVRTSILAPEGIEIEDFQIASDGGRISFIGTPIEIQPLSGVRHTALYTRRLDEASAKKIPMSEGVFNHRFANDGRSIAFITRGAESSDLERVMRVPADGSSQPIEVMRVPGEYHWGPDRWFCWTPRGELAFLDRTNLVLGIHDADSGREIRRVRLELEDRTADLAGLDGPYGDRHVLVSMQRFTPEGFRFDSGLIDIDTGQITIAAPNTATLELIRGNEVVFARGDTIYRSEFDVDQLVLSGKLRAVQSGLATTSTWDNGDFVVADNGTLVYLPGGRRGAQREVLIIDREGATTPWTDERRAFEDSIDVSADGTRLAVTIAGVGGLFEIWVSETDRPRLRRLIGAPAADFHSPEFTPDGTHIVAARWAPREEEPGRIFIMPFDGSAPPRRLIGGWKRDDWTTPESISRDGKRVLARALEGGRARLLEIGLDREDDVRELLDERELHTPRCAPTADLIAYISLESGRAEAYIRTIGTDGVGPPIPVTTRGAWSLDWIVDEAKGLSILHFDLEWKEWITPVSLEGGDVRVGDGVLTGRLGNPRIEASAFTRDGRRVAVLRGDDERADTHLELVQGWVDSLGP